MQTDNQTTLPGLLTLPADLPQTQAMPRPSIERRYGLIFGAAVLALVLGAYLYWA